MNADLVKQALKIVLNPNVLVNMVSQRVRQLNSGGRGMNNPLVNTPNLNAADVALLEIIEEKMGFEMPEIIKLTRRGANKGKRPHNWAKWPSTVRALSPPANI